MVPDGGVRAYQQCIEQQRQGSIRAGHSGEEEQQRAQREQGREQVYRLERFGVFLVEIDACDARIVYLLEELPEIGAPFVVHPCVGEEAAAIARFEDAYAEVDVFAEAHLREAAQRLVDVAADAHVEAAGVELVHFLLASADAAGGEERGHGVVDGLLEIAERLVGTVGSSEGVGGAGLEFLLHGLQIARRQDAVGVQDDEVFPLAAFGAVVAGLSGAGVGLIIIMYIQAAGVFFHDFPAGDGGTVFHYHHFKVAESLAGEALQELVCFVGAVIDGDDDGVSFHGLSVLSLAQR